MMSMKGDGKPISFIEDCAVRLEDLAEYTDRLTQVFHKHGTVGTWYAHASVGTLHVRPVINLKQELGAKQMRAIAEEAFAMVREYKGSHSGEHGDGLVRSEFHEPMFGSRLVRAFEEVKDTFDPTGLFNPGKIVRPPKMDDRSLFRFKPGYRQLPLDTVLDWSEWGSFASAAEMCNNNGACRKSDPGVMCPSYRATGDEQHLTRGRANTLRLALSGQLGPDALVSDEMRDTMALCVSCKGCKRECPTGVDMARMKIEFLHHYRKRHGLTARDRAIAYLPRYAPYAARLARCYNLRNRVPALAALGEKVLGFSARRQLPEWSSKPYRGQPAPQPSPRGGEAAPTPSLRRKRGGRVGPAPRGRAAGRHLQPLFRAGKRARRRAGFDPRRLSGDDPRTGRRPAAVLRPHLSRVPGLSRRRERRRGACSTRWRRPIVAGTPIVGLEPACLLTLRDEFPAILPGDETKALAARAQLFEEFVAAERKAGRFDLPLAPMPGRSALLHGHCHQKAFDTANAAAEALRLIPELTVETFEFDLLRHGRLVRSRSRALRHVDADRRIGRIAEDARRRARHDARRLRHQLPPPDRRRRRPRGPSHRPHSGRGVPLIRRQVGGTQGMRPNFIPSSASSCDSSAVASP